MKMKLDKSKSIEYQRFEKFTRKLLSASVKRVRRQLTQEKIESSKNLDSYDDSNPQPPN